MKKALFSAACLLMLAACGGSSNENSRNADGQAPKPVFKIKHIDTAAIEGLALTPSGSSGDGEKAQSSYQIDGLSGDNYIVLSGKNPADLETISGKCMETDEAGRKTGWREGGICHTLFARLLDNVAQDAPALTAYLLSHAGLQPYQAEKSGYAAVQNGRYIIETDSEGMFFFRRRHY
ncbi:hypothetical protein [Bergeriella denitrificans]|uniref:Lipoprotein n=1 Tax=Bergeriella denitrificans TaxID=494 RepID=A0A378UEZ8_BERDE|nr:hypothetical protein [Bergeriella denitrificans]STZ75964.1 Uncharacterised protein [Bergeriella denitrificans]